MIRTGGERGQAVTETMMMMAFLLLMIFGLAHFSMLVATKQMLDYAAFAAARTALVDGDRDAAAREVMDASLRWSNQSPRVTGADCRSTQPGTNRGAIGVSIRVPFGLPIFNNIPAGGLLVSAFAPCTVQDDYDSGVESGDNADAFGVGF